MAEYIDREAVLSDAYETVVFSTRNGATSTEVRGANKVIDRIKSAPTADVVEVRHGKWMPIVIQESYLDPPYCDTCKCSMCEYEIDVSETIYNYCPNCGAKMDLEG